MNSMLSKLVDPCHLVRKLCIKGLGNVSSVGGQKVCVLENMSFSIVFCSYLLHRFSIVFFVAVCRAGVAINAVLIQHTLCMASVSACDSLFGTCC